MEAFLNKICVANRSFPLPSESWVGGNGHGEFSPGNPLARHSRKSGNPANQTRREADKTMFLVRYARIVQYNWIPAFAGMTQFVANELWGLIIRGGNSPCPVKMAKSYNGDKNTLSRNLFN